MSHPLINRNADLRQLRDEGYYVEVVGAYLMIKNVPYVNAAKQVRYGTLVSELTLAGEATQRPNTHVAYFAGEHPCNSNGNKLKPIEFGSTHAQMSDVVVQHSFSAKPAEGYSDYYHKMATYANILSTPARLIEPGATAQVFPPSEEGVTQADPIFVYADTASVRAGIGAVSDKLRGGKIGIVGLGGTGSYVLDLVAKTPVSEIHLFDGDLLLNHNAFRSPGAPSLEELGGVPAKVNYFAAIYSRMHRGVTAHCGFVDASNVAELHGLDFVFLCLDRGEAKKLIIEHLEAWGISFVDVGMGVSLVDGALHGVARTTASTASARAHVREKGRIPFSDGVGNDYAQNIQIADLNALNAALAVIKWKKLRGFYHDLEGEHYSTYTIDTNSLNNADQGGTVGS